MAQISLLHAQNSTVVRDALPSEAASGANSSNFFDKLFTSSQDLQKYGRKNKSELNQSISEEDMGYYGLDEDKDRVWSTSVLFSGVYDSNIFISENGQVDDFIWTIAPDITFEPYHIQENSPHYFKLNYGPEFQFFTQNPSEDSIEHSGIASYLYKGDVFTANAKHQSATESGATRDVGNRTSRDIHTTQGAINAQLFDKWSLLGIAQQELTFYDNQNDLHQWHAEGFLLHQPNKKLTLGIGTKFGWVDITGSPNQDFQQGLIKISYHPHPDWGFNLTGGAELRAFQDSAGVDDRVTPVFQSDITYRVAAKTHLTLSGYRRVLTSAGITGANYVVTGGSLGLEHSFFDRFKYGGVFGVEYADYYNTATTIATLQRDDLFYYTNHQLSFQYNQHLSFALHYTWMMNDSNVAEFTANRVGFSTTITY